MKKIISLLMVLILALCPLAAFATGTPSPTIGKVSLFQSEPKITYMLPAPDETWLKLGFDKYLDDLHTWTLLDVAIIKTEDSYPEWLCKFSMEPTEDQEIGIVLTTIEYEKVYAAIGEKMENGWVKFDLSDINPDTYVMFVYVSKAE